MAKQKKKSYSSIEEELEDLAKGLTEKQLLFCEYFLPTLNATTSYMKAYGVGRASANRLGSKTLAHIGVRAYIECQKRLRARNNFLTQEDILEKYKAIAFADMNDYIEIQEAEGIDQENGETYTYNRLVLKKSAEVDGTIVTEIVKDSKGGIKIKLADKMQALKFLSNYTNMLNDDEVKKLQAAKLSYEVENLKNGMNVNAAQITIVNSWDGEENETD